MKQPFSVIGVYDDASDQRFCKHVKADSPEEAEKIVIQESKTAVLVAGVVRGHVSMSDAEPTTNVTDIKSLGAQIEVCEVVVTSRMIHVPYKCPGCQKDLRATSSITRKALVVYKAYGHIDETDQEIVSDIDGKDDSINIANMRLACSTCHQKLWEGFHHG